MEKDLKALYLILEYEEGFALSEVSSSYHRKKFVDTRVVVSEVGRKERKKILGED